MDDERTPDPIPETTPQTGPAPESPTAPLPAAVVPAGVLMDEASGGGTGGGASGGGPPGHEPIGHGGHDDGSHDDRSPGAGATGGDGSPRRLRRDMEHRILGGVAAGTARYLDIDVIFVRIAFAILALFGGSGALLYVAAWLLIPTDEDEQPLAQQWTGRRPSRRSLTVMIVGAVVGIIALTDLFSSGPWWPHRDGGAGLVLGAVALALAVGLVAGSGGNRTARSRLRWLFLSLLLSVLAIVVVAAATVFSIEAASGVPLRGGIGNTQWQPTSASQLAPNYRLAMGNLTVDLSDVPFRPGTTHVTASVGVGQLVVKVPPGPSVSVVAHSGLGDVEIFGRNNGGLSTVESRQSSGSGTMGRRSHIVVDADAGVGKVEVERTVSALS